MARLGDQIERLARTIRRLAQSSLTKLPASSEARPIAELRALRPIDYMRYAEFAAILDGLTVSPGMKVLDISSPQWFSLALAAENPYAQFVYANILEEEISPFRQIAGALDLTNIEYQRRDVRSLKSEHESYDRVISISVLEHIYPEVGGDVIALKNIKDVLTQEGELHLTVPFKNRGNILFVDGPVYERGGEKHNFYAREYDEASFAHLVLLSGLELKSRLLICEKRGLFAVDFFEWGPGSSTIGRAYVKSRKILEKLFGVSTDAFLARHYLEVSDGTDSRLVNIAAILKVSAKGQE